MPKPNRRRACVGPNQFAIALVAPPGLLESDWCDESHIPGETVDRGWSRAPQRSMQRFGTIRYFPGRMEECRPYSFCRSTEERRPTRSLRGCRNATPAHSRTRPALAVADGFFGRRQQACPVAQVSLNTLCLQGRRITFPAAAENGAYRALAKTRQNRS
jgi:hypothetical protein